jgi:3-oxoacyl-(acyl-carrier-protein) synthase
MPPCVITALRAIGHTLGAAAPIAAAMASARCGRVLPAVLNLTDPDLAGRADLRHDGALSTDERRAVNAFGFGGQNSR